MGAKIDKDQGDLARIEQLLQSRVTPEQITIEICKRVSMDGCEQPSNNDD